MWDFEDDSSGTERQSKSWGKIGGYFVRDEWEREIEREGG